MDDRSQTGLEFTGVLSLLQEAANTPLGKERAQHLSPVHDLERVQEALAEAAEAKALFERGEEPPFGRRRRRHRKPPRRRRARAASAPPRR